ncbi:MAG TPA: diguanylate cyclase, partial [Burkholderiales bacterium]|nr:diguanylate cyclase [Burkholderiales bacterium]
MNRELRILLIEDVPTDAELEIRELKRAGMHIAHRIVDTEGAFRAALREFLPELIISDFSMPHFDGMWALALARELAPEVPFIFVSGTIGEEYAIRALKNGATDYVLKNNLVRLPASVDRALQDHAERAARRRAEEALRESEEKYRLLWETASDAVVLMDGDSRIQYANPSVMKLFGYAPEEVVGREIAILQPERLREAHRAGIGRYLETGAKTLNWRSSEVVGLHRDGHEFPVEVSFSHVDFGGKPLFAGFMRDITERKSQEFKIARLSRIHAVLSGINSAIVRIRDRQKLFDEACRIAVEHGGFGMAFISKFDPVTLDVIPVAQAGTESGEFGSPKTTARANVPMGQGVVGHAIRGKELVFVNDLTSEPDVGSVKRKEAIRRGYRSLIALPLLVESAVFGTLTLYAKELNFFNQDELKLLTELADDISFALEHIAKEEKLNYLAYFDPLTGLANRALFHDRLDRVLQGESRPESKLALVIIDLKRFGSVNDTYGRQTGDALLKQVAERLEGVLMSREWLARIEANSFAIVVRDVRHEAEVAHALEQGILSCLNQPFPVGGEELRLSAQTGIALAPVDGNDAESLFRNADAALKKAKNTGEDYLFYAPQMNARVAHQLKLENDLRNALLQEQYVLYYQPKFDLASGRIIGVEALIRWRHPERGMVSPAEFVPVLEETGMILDVGRWALIRAARDHADWSGAGRVVPRIAVNVSPVQLR